MKYAILGVGIVIVSIVLIRKVKRRNIKVDTWGASIPVSNAQQEVMSILWKAAQNKKPPEVDPLLSLSKEDRQYLLKICSANFRPAKYGDANVLRLSAYLSLLDEGFNQEQAAIIVGMIFNSVGKKGLYNMNDEYSPSHKNQAEEPIRNDWIEILKNSDFKTASFEIRRVFSSQVSYAKTQQQDLYLKKELNEALINFMNRPCFDTAVILLEISPELLPFFTDTLFQH